jgi:hypothetical protein
MSDDQVWATLNKIDSKLDTLAGQFADMRANGCSKAASHETLFDRVRAIETTQAEGRGKMGVVIAIATAVGMKVLELLGSNVHFGGAAK